MSTLTEGSSHISVKTAFHITIYTSMSIQIKKLVNYLQFRCLTLKSVFGPVCLPTLERNTALLPFFHTKKAQFDSPPSSLQQ